MSNRSRNGPPSWADPATLTAAIGVDLDAGLLECALTHRSYAYENGGVAHNERLEFLGDSVLGIVVTDALYRGHPDLAEGRLAKMRASVVNMRALAAVARTIGPDGLGSYLRLGRGEEVTGGRDKPSILADALEALLGAVYLGAGMDAAFAVVHRLFDALLEQAAYQGAALDWKTSLQELTALLGLGVPDYSLSFEGPDHERRFTARAVVSGEYFAPCEGRNKKEAEQAAASAAWTVLRARTPEGVPAEPLASEQVPPALEVPAVPEEPAVPEPVTTPDTSGA